MTMRIHELSSTKKRVQRIGRSGKRGSYSGRGVKGQKSRAGRRLHPAERDLIMRIPKHRGFRNLPKREATTVFNLDQLSSKLKSFAHGDGPVLVTQESLITAKLINKSFRGRIKVLGTGEMAFPVAVAGLMVSESAKAKIEKAGGSVAAPAK